MAYIAYDLGTGGVKASLYKICNGVVTILAKTFVEYDTFYPKANMHEQRPKDWWEALVKSTRALLVRDDVKNNDIKGGSVECISLSGHSLVSVPIDANRNILLDQVPIWSDSRAIPETEEFFSHIDQNDWYLTTGNGFPAPCYSIFKLMWLKKHDKNIFSKIHKVLGSKDYINMMLTGELYTDYSYASGSGAYDLKSGRFNEDFLEAAGIPISIFPEIIHSHQIIGSLTKEAANELGLSTNTKVTCGGVDNACMALGAVGGEEGRCYTSLGSSSWIAVNSKEPVLDCQKKPYVFAHLEEGMFTSAFSIFSGGGSLRWVRDQICRDVLLEGTDDTYEKIGKLAAAVPIGSGGVIFNPSLAGGTSQDKSIHIRGAFLNLSLGSTRSEMLRAAMEGIAMNLRLSLDNLKERVKLSDEMLFCGGGSKSTFWMQMFADIFEMAILKTNIDQDAASLGAAAAAFRAMGLWKDYSPILKIHVQENRNEPIPENVKLYRNILPIFTYANSMMSDLGAYLYENQLANM